MFKAKLVENESYYKLRSKQLLFMLLPALPIGFLVNFYTVPIWLTIGMIFIYIIVIILMFKNQKEIDSVLGNRSIEIDGEEIRIKSNKGERLEVISIAEVDKLILNGAYSMPQETFKDLGKEMSGRVKKNYLIVKKNSESRKLNFEFDSYFMIEQLRKIISIWEDKGYNIERR